MKPLRSIRTTTIKLAFYILAGNDKKCTLFDYICFWDVKHKPIDFSPSDRIKTARQIGERKISKVLNPTGSRNRQTIYSLPRFLASLILFQKFFKNLKHNSHNLLIVPFVSTNNNHANQKTTCLLSFQSHVSCFLKYVLSLIQKMLLWTCLFWETEDKQWKLSGRTLGKRHSLRRKRFRGSGFGAKKDRGKRFSVLTARELKREPENVLFLFLSS